MAYPDTHVDQVSVFEAIDNCSDINDLATLTTTSLGAVLGCDSSTVSEVAYRNAAPRLGRHYVSASLEKAIRGYVVNFEKISQSLFGGADRENLSMYFMETRVESALHSDFDPRPIWRRMQLRNILTMRVSCMDNVDFYFTFNRLEGSPAFGEAELGKARQLFFMLSATARRLVAEERLCRFQLRPNTLGKEEAVGVIGGDCRYAVSRFATAHAPIPIADHLADFRKSRNTSAMLYIRPSETQTPMSSLTPAELKVAQLVAQGYSNKDIARQQSISVYTVENQLKSVYRKLNTHGRSKLAANFMFSFGEDPGTSRTTSIGQSPQGVD